MASYTALQLVQEMGKAAGTYRNGTATAGANSSLTDLARRTEETDALRDAVVVLTDTGLANYGTSNWRRVNGNTQTTGVVSIVGTWATNPAASSTYDLYLEPFHPVYHFYPALNLALSEHFPSLPVSLHTRVRVPRATTRIAVPTTYTRVESVLRQGGSELLTNDDWLDGTTGWTLGTSHALANTGDDQDRVLSVPNTNESYQDVAVVGGHEYDVSAAVENDGTRTTNLLIRWLANGSQIGSDVTIGTSSATTKTRLGSKVTAPVNATHVRVVLTASGSGAGKVYYASVSEVRPWIALRSWEVVNDSGTRYLELGGAVAESYDLQLRGQGINSTLDSDDDTVTLDVNQMRYLVAKALAKAYRMLGADSIIGATQAREIAASWDAQGERIRRDTFPPRGVPIGRPAMSRY